jgi:acyl transferase domain-containing protein/7-keto-8-aminopelargonate synthetase-like enzyme/NAD(P)-dependent dehydrogenase (short-subunit alcohol dehydrogenase family)
LSRIAIVGMSCRFAGAPDLHAFWSLTRAGRHSFGPVPEDRWSAAMFHTDSARDMDRTTAPHGAFIHDIRSFPALALGIPPRRVEVMDPQQRFALLTAMEAIEDAGYRSNELPRATGVFVGLTAHEYRVLQAARTAAMMMASGQLGQPPQDLDALADAVENIVPPRPFSAPGVLGNMSAATVAQELDLHGPAYTTDAACASALVAIADAVAHLRAGLIDAALAGGSYIQITPEHYVAFSRIGAMSDSGYCRPFDARADGFVQGDGVGMLLLKRLEDAQRDGDRIVAVIEGVALNNDGRGDGPMAPVLEGQVEVIRAAWADAKLDPASVSFVEAHGTGTQVGDATEAQGLATVFHAAKQVHLGSSKANIGHTMSAAGVAGVLRAALAIHHATIPPLAGFESAKSGLDGTPLVVPTSPQLWDDPGRRAGVSSFGFGGTNGHAVLSRGSDPQPASGEAQLITLSAPDIATLRDLARRTADAVRADATITAEGVARAWAVRRRQPARAAVVARDRAALLDALDAIGAGSALPAGVRVGEAGPAPRIALLYPGQGAQRIGMLRQLRARFPLIRDALQAQEEALEGLLETPLTQLLYPEVADAAAAARLTATQHTQPVMFAVGWALTALLRAVGVQPVVATGHSLGEFVAAAVAGVWSPEDAVRFVARRGRAMADLPGEHGAMAAITADRDTVASLLVEGAVIANENHPRQLVVSGTTAAVDAVVRAAQARDIVAKRLDVSHAFHSPLIASVDSKALLDGLTLRAPELPVASGISATPYQSAEHARQVFEQHATSPVIFTRALQQCAEAGADLYLQVGAGGPLASFARGTLKEGVRAILTLASMEDDDGGVSLLDTLGALWVAGADLDVRPITTPCPPASVPPSALPTEVYWAVKDKPTRGLTLKPGQVRAPRAVEPEASAPVVAAAPEPVEAGDADPVVEGVLRVVSKVSAYPRAALRTSARLTEDLGFDSLMIGDLATGLGEAFPGLGGIPQELLINSPTVQDLVDLVRKGPAASDDRDDQAPLLDLRPVWRARALPELPTSRLPEGVWVVSGPEADGVDRLVVDLTEAGLRARAARPEALAAADQPLTGLIWLGPAVAPRVAAVLSGKVETPDEAAPLLSVLAKQAALGAKPDVIAISAPDDVWAAGVAGALRALSREWPEARVKHIGTDDRRLIARRVVNELSSADRTTDVRWTRGQRLTLSLDPVEAKDSSGLTSADVVVITGGTRGIGLRLALRIAPDVGRVILLGRRPPADSDAAAISAFKNVSAVAVDVLDLEALRAALKGARATVLVHAAGVLADGPVEHAAGEAARAARQIKVQGWLNALRACGPSLRRAVALGSWAGRFGNRHQVAYAAANALLAELAEHPPTGVVAVTGEFGPWTDSDMVRTLPAAARQAMRADGIDFVAWEPGLTAIVRDLSHAGGAIVHGRRVPHELARARTTLRLSTEADPYLLDHAIEGTPILPLAAAADLMAWSAGVRPPFEVRDVKLFQGVTVREPVQLTLACQDGRASVRQGPQQALAYTAEVRALSSWTDPAPAPTGGEPPALDVETFYRDATFHGPRLQGLVRIDAVGPDFIRGAVRAAAPRDWSPATARQAFAADPLALDSAMQLAASVAWVRYQRAGTPVKIGRLAVREPLIPGRVYNTEARFQADEAERGGDRFTATLVLRDDNGRAVLVAEDVVAELRKVAGVEAPWAPDPITFNADRWPEVQQLQARLAGVAAMGLRNPYFHVHEGTARNTTVVGGRRLVNFSSYNYIGLSGDPDVLSAVHVAVERYGTSVSASRVASGERPFHGELEALLARCQGADDALLFTAGHATNVTTIGHLFGAEDLILHDEYIHDSALQGIKLSGAARRGFRHDEPEHLEQQLKQLRPHYRRCLIVVEGVYSMDGDICALPEYVRLKKEHGCLLMVDEAHSFGVIGATGRGIAEHYGIDGREIDLWMGTLSKSLASCGGWIAGSKPLITFLRYTAPGFVYSAGLTAANGMAALASLKKMLAEPWRVRQLQGNAAFFHDELVQRGLDTGPAMGGSGVVPVVTGNSAHALMLSQALGDHGVNVQPIVYPAVAENAARLRFFLSSTHTRAELAETAEKVDVLLEAIREAHPA